MHQIVRDIDLLTTAEYLVDRHHQAKKKRLVRQLDKAKLAGQEGKFFKMRKLLDAIIRNARPNRLARNLGDLRDSQGAN